MPFYAAERWVGGRQESFAEYKLRVRRDIELGAKTLARNLPGWRSHGTFALPYGDYGQRGSNDPRLVAWFSGLLKKRFTVAFAHVPEPFTPPGRGFAPRIAVPSTWTVRTLATRVSSARAGG